MKFKGQKVLVVGAGVSGIASCRYLLKNSCSVLLYDNKPREILLQKPEIVALEKAGVTLLCGNSLPEQIDWNLVVLSPGVPPGIPVVYLSKAAGVKIIGEIELAYQAAKAPFLAITGTNGKTTTTALLGHIMEQCHVEALVGGNIGTPLVDAVTDFNGEYIVAELSSFQLESCVDFRAHAAAYLNLTPDHLDRHGTMEAYGAAKEKIFANQTKENFTILNMDDPATRAAGMRTQGKVLWFSLHEAPENGIYFDEEKLHYMEAGQEVYSFDAENIFIKGRHNIQNVMAAFLLATAAGLPQEEIRSAIFSFRGVAHRLEYVTEKDGVLFVNDSKGTNPDSTFQAINAYDRPMILILGGRNKGSDLVPLIKLVQEKVKKAVFYGEAALEFKQAADIVGYHQYEMADSFDHAVELCKKQAIAGDVVVLSPACASWDSFPCFEARGDRFKELVLQ